MRRYYVTVVDRKHLVAAHVEGFDAIGPAETRADELRERFSDHFKIEIYSAKTGRTVKAL